MEWFDVFLKIVSVATALGLVWKWFTGVVHKIDGLRDDIKELKEHSFENYLAGLRLTIMSSDMPIGERIIAADNYIKAGGNGDIKRYAIDVLHVKDVHHND